MTFYDEEETDEYLDPAGAVGGAPAPKRARVNIISPMDLLEL